LPPESSYFLDEIDHVSSYTICSIPACHTLRSRKLLICISPAPNSYLPSPFSTNVEKHHLHHVHNHQRQHHRRGNHVWRNPNLQQAMQINQRVNATQSRRSFDNPQQQVALIFFDNRGQIVFETQPRLRQPRG